MWPTEASSPIHEDDILHNVKFFVMKEDGQWEFICSGLISTKDIEQIQGTCLLVHSQSNDLPLFEALIYPGISYKKHKKDLIIFTESNNHTMAIHFSDPNFCEDFWEDICQKEGKAMNAEIPDKRTELLNGFEDVAQVEKLCKVSISELSKLEAIADTFTFAGESPSYQERLALVLENEDYIKKLLQYFHTFENEKFMEGLYYLYIIIRGIIFLNNASMLKFLFSDECILDVIGCLEYNPALTQPSQHRKFLLENAKFKGLIPIMHFKLRQKIFQTYRMQYIFDILSPTSSKTQENLSNLTTFIFSNKVEIVTILQQDEMFLLEIIAQLKYPTVADEKRYELLCFLREFCSFAKIIRVQKKDTLLETLIKLGILSALKLSLCIKQHEIKFNTLEIFTYLVEYNPQIVQEHAVNEAQRLKNDGCLLVNIMIKQIFCDSDPESSCVLSLTSILRVLLGPENIYGTNNGCERIDFIHFFYKHCMNNLAAPILSITGQNDSDDNRANICPDDYKSAQLLGEVLELLSFCVNHHKTYIRNYILSNNLLSRVLVLMNSKHTFLILCALRFMRQIIGLNDEIYNLYITGNNLFEPVVNAFLHNGEKYNMLNSAIIEIFEFIQEKNIKPLIANIVQNFSMDFESIEYVQTFKKLKIKFEEEKERENQAKGNLHNIVQQQIYLRHMKTMEIQVNDDLCSRGNTETIPSIRQDFLNCNNMFFKNKETCENQVELPERKSSEAIGCYLYQVDASNTRMSRTHCQRRVSLVDYSEDDDSENDDNHADDEVEEEAPSLKRPKLGS